MIAHVLAFLTNWPDNFINTAHRKKKNQTSAFKYMASTQNKKQILLYSTTNKMIRAQQLESLVMPWKAVLAKVLPYYSISNGHI